MIHPTSAAVQERPAPVPVEPPPPRLRTLQLGSHFFHERPGGLERVFLRLLEHLPSAGVTVRGLVAGDRAEGDVRPFAPASGRLASRALGLRAAVRAAMRDLAPDLVASHFALYTAPALDLLRDTPLVAHFHGPWASEGAAEGAGRLKTALKRSVERAVLSRAARFVVLSAAFREVLLREFRVDADAVRVVPGGVDVEQYEAAPCRAEARARLGWPTDRPVVLTVRRLVCRMGLEDLIDATAEIRRSCPEVLVVVAGSGPLAGALEARVRALGLERHVRQLGYVDERDLALAYRAADLTVVPTVALEGFGLVAAESLAAGTPVLVTPVGGLPEVVCGLEPALVLAATGAAAVAAGLGDALAGRVTLPSAAACSRYARDRYAWPVVARGVRAVYDEVA